MSGTSQIVKPETLDQITHALSQLDLAQQELDLAMRAGIHELPGGETLKQAQEQIDTNRKRLLSIKHVYFPNS